MKNKAKELVVISGKGGTGKTSIVASFAALAKKAVLADCDVDAADLHLVLEPEIIKREKFSGGSRARIKSGHCTACGKCVSACPKNIVSIEDASEKYYVKCLSRDKTTIVKNACKAGCIGCKICEKLSKGVFIVENDLSRLDHAKVNDTTPLKLCIEKCPAKCIVST